MRWGVRMPVRIGFATGEAKTNALRLDFDRRIRLEFHGTELSSNGGVLLFRELDEVFGLTEMASCELWDKRTGRNTQHNLRALVRQSVFGRLAGYEEVNDASWLSQDPIMRVIVGRDGMIGVVPARVTWTASRPRR